jgi:hypothetical protein
VKLQDYPVNIRKVLEDKFNAKTDEDLEQITLRQICNSLTPGHRNFVLSALELLDLNVQDLSRKLRDDGTEP